MRPDLRDALLNLDATGENGFEGLLAELLGNFTNQRFVLYASGWQAGKDALAASPRWGVVALQAKRYQDAPSATALLGDFTAAALDTADLDIWVVGCVSPLPSQTKEKLEQASHRTDVSVVILDDLALEAVIYADADIADRRLGLQLSTADLPTSRLAEHESLLQTTLEELQQLPLLSRLAEATNDYLKEHTSGGSIRLGRRIDVASTVPRVFESKITEWWSRPTPLPLCIEGEEGMGKTTVVARWLVQNPSPIPVIWIAARDVSQAISLEDLAVDSLAKMVRSRNMGISEGRLARQLPRWFKSMEPRVLLILDGLNELALHRAVEVVQALSHAPLKAAVGTSLRVIITCRPTRWNQIAKKLDPNPFLLHPLSNYVDSEFAAALAGSGVAIRDIPTDTEELLLRPLYCSAALRYIKPGESLANLTRETLCWMGIRHRLAQGVGLTRGLTVDSEDDALRFLSDIARSYQKRGANQELDDCILVDSLGRFVTPGFSPDQALTELSSMRLLKKRFTGNELDADHLVFGLALLLLNLCLSRFQQEAVPSSEGLIEEIETFLEPNVGLEERAVQTALLLSRTAEVFDEDREVEICLPTVRVALLIVWSRLPNFNEISERVFLDLFPDLVYENFELAEYLWSERDGSERVRSLLVSGLHRYAQDCALLSDEVIERLNRWFRLAHEPYESQVPERSRQIISRTIGRGVHEELARHENFARVIEWHSLEPAVTLHQTKLFYLALMVLSVTRDPRLFPAFVDSNLADQVCNRNADKVYSWVVGFLLGPEFSEFVLKLDEPSDRNLRSRSINYFRNLTSRRDSKEAKPQHVTEPLTSKWREGRVAELLALLKAPESKLLTRQLAGYDWLFTDPDLLRSLSDDADAHSTLIRAVKELLGQLPTSTLFMWRGPFTTRESSLLDSHAALLCSMGPSEWAGILAEQIRLRSEDSTAGLHLFDIDHFAPAFEKEPLEKLLQHFLTSQPKNKPWSTSYHFQVRHLLCCLFLHGMTVGELLSLDLPADFDYGADLRLAIQETATPQCVQSLLNDLKASPGSRTPLALHLLLDLAFRVKDGELKKQIETISLQEWKSKTLRIKSLAIQILRAVGGELEKDSVLNNWSWNEDKWSEGGVAVAYSLREISPYLNQLNLSELLSLLPLDLIGGVVNASELAEYLKLLHQALQAQEKAKLPEAPCALEMTVPTPATKNSPIDCGAIRMPIQAEETLDLRDLGHWRNADRPEGLSMEPGDLQAELQQEHAEWLQCLLLRKDHEPFYSHWIYSPALDRIAEENLVCLQGWIDEFLGASDSKQERLYLNRSSFYWSLTLAVLNRDPERGIKMWRFIDRETGFLLTDGGARVPSHLVALFKAKPASELIVVFRNEVLQKVDHDLRIFQIAQACAKGDTAWLLDWSYGQMETGDDLQRAVAVRVVGWLPYDSSILAKLISVRDSDPSPRVAEIAELASEAQRRDNFARHWLDQVRNEPDPKRACAAAQLFRLTADPRVFGWWQPTDFSENFFLGKERHSRYLEAQLYNDLGNLTSNKCKKLRKTFLNQEIHLLQGLVYPFLETELRVK